MRQVNLAISSLTHAHVRKYYATLDSNAKLNWVAVSCATEAVAEDFKLSGYDIPIYMSTEQMLQEHPEIDGVVIASQNHQHFADMELCAKYGKHMLSMKIPTFDLEEHFQRFFQHPGVHRLGQSRRKPEHIAPVLSAGSGIDLRRVIQRQPV